MTFNALFYHKSILDLIIPFTWLFFIIYYCFIYYHSLHCHLLPFITNHLNGIYCHLWPRATFRWTSWFVLQSFLQKVILSVQLQSSVRFCPAHQVKQFMLSWCVDINQPDLWNWKPAWSLKFECLGRPTGSLWPYLFYQCGHHCGPLWPCFHSGHMSPLTTVAIHHCGPRGSVATVVITVAMWSPLWPLLVWKK